MSRIIIVVSVLTCLAVSPVVVSANVLGAEGTAVPNESNQPVDLKAVQYAAQSGLTNPVLDGTKAVAPIFVSATPLHASVLAAGVQSQGATGRSVSGNSVRSTSPSRALANSETAPALESGDVAYDAPLQLPLEPRNGPVVDEAQGPTGFRSPIQGGGPQQPQRSPNATDTSVPQRLEAPANVETFAVLLFFFTFFLLMKKGFKWF
jgi:hypothetical protein